MGLFEDLSQFLETRLEEFLRTHPQLELMALEDQLREQQEDTLKLLNQLRQQEQQLESDILNTAQEVKLWHIRIDKARSANRLDLVEPALEREAALLRQGNQLWGQMKGVKERIQKTDELQRQVKIRLQEVQAKIAEARKAEQTAQAAAASGTAGWTQSQSYQSYAGRPDPLETKFRQWEMDAEIEALKRNLDR